jgi:hypothetical protein
MKDCNGQELIVGDHVEVLLRGTVAGKRQPGGGKVVVYTPDGGEVTVGEYQVEKLLSTETPPLPIPLPMVNDANPEVR